MGPAEAVRAMGPGAVLIAAGDQRPASVADAIRASVHEVRDVVVGADSVLVIADRPALLDQAAAVAAEVAAGGTNDVAEEGRTIEIPTVYDGADLIDVAGATGMSEAAVIDLHAGAAYEVAFVGFAPGFGYLSGLPDALRLPRRAEPRSRVPAGSVAIADRYAAVYPRETPGGWHLLGRTDEVLFDPARQPPALLVPGSRVRFVPTRAAAGPRRLPQAASTMEAGAGPQVEVVDPGGFTTVQDLGRPGRGAEGVPPSGAADRAAARLANRLVGNDEGVAVLETTVAGPVLRLGGTTVRAVAVTGPPGPIDVDGGPRGTAAAFDVWSEQVVRVGPPGVGLRRYVAIAGGFCPPLTLGSRSTDVLTGLGPAPLAAGDVVPVGEVVGARPSIDVAPVATRGAEIAVRAWAGPHRRWLTEGAETQLLAGPWVVAPTSNRIAVRLDGPGLERADDAEVATVGLLAGAVQLTPAGQLVVFGPDHPVTGGYPVVAVIDPRDLDLIAQLRPGERLGLVPGSASGGR